MSSRIQFPIPSSFTGKSKWKSCTKKNAGANTSKSYRIWIIEDTPIISHHPKSRPFHWIGTMISVRSMTLHHHQNHQIIHEPSVVRCTISRDKHPGLYCMHTFTCTFGSISNFRKLVQLNEKMAQKLSGDQIAIEVHRNFRILKIERYLFEKYIPNWGNVSSVNETLIVWHWNKINTWTKYSFNYFFFVLFLATKFDAPAESWASKRAISFTFDVKSIKIGTKVKLMPPLAFCQPIMLR